MKEIALKIGKPIPLTAIVSTPRELDPEKPAVLILNSGVMHHIGTCRLSVKIARQLAQEGTLAIRFDLSGIGDSAPRTGTHSFHETAIREITEVMDYLQAKRGIKSFVAFGLCSGADASYDIALADPRITGIAQIDPYCYRTWSWYIKHYGPKIFKLAVWINAFKVRFVKQPESKKLGENIESDNVEMPSYIREFPPRADVAKGMQTLVDRGVRIFSLFTGGQGEILNHESQFEQSMSPVDFKGLLTVAFHPDMDHIITDPALQRLTRDSICSWVAQL